MRRTILFWLMAACALIEAGLNVYGYHQRAALLRTVQLANDAAEHWQNVAHTWEINAHDAQQVADNWEHVAARWQKDFDDLKKATSLPFGDGDVVPYPGPQVRWDKPPVMLTDCSKPDEHGCSYSGELAIGLPHLPGNIRIDAGQLCGPGECVDVDTLIRWLRNQAKGK